MYKESDTRMDWFEYENIQMSLQCKHTNMLRNYTPKNESVCKWIKPGEQIEINGLIIKNGFFYVGEFFEIPKSFKNNIFEYNNLTYNNQYKLSRIYGPVIQDNLPIENGSLTIEPFSSYIDMHPTHRYEYLSWLAGKIPTCELSTATLYFHLFGLQIRMFVDDTTDDDERLDIIKHSMELYTQCLDNGIMAFDLGLFIEAAISNYFSNNVFDIIHSEIACYNNSDETRGDALCEICRTTINKYNLKGKIPSYLITDFFHHQASLFFESEFSKYVKGEKSNVLEGYLYISNDYNFFSLSGSTCDACFCSDYYIDVKLDKKSFPICQIIDRSLKFFFNETVSQLTEYRSLHKISPTLSLFTLPQSFNLCDYENSMSYVEKMKRMTESEKYVLFPINDLLDLDNIATGKEKTIEKKQIISIIKCINKIGYGIVPNFIVDEIRFNHGDNCIIYRESDSERLDKALSCQMEPIIKVCAYIIEESQLESNIAFIDNFIKKEVNDIQTQKYLMAYLRWILLASSSKLTRKDKDSIANMSNVQKKHILITATCLTTLNNQFITERMDKLKDVLLLLNLNPSTIHTLIHRISIEDDKFVTIEKETIDYNHTVSLSGEQLANVEKQTKLAQDLLSDIFANNIEEKSEKYTKNDVLLDILSILLTKESWKRNDVESLCQERHLMIGSVLEQLNDFSFSKIDDAVIEDDGDTIYVMTEYKDKLI